MTQHTQEEVVSAYNANCLGTLRKSGDYQQGPCPLCGGEDRFYIRADGGYYCRQCLPDGKDATMLAAMSRELGLEAPPPAKANGHDRRPPPTPPPQTSETPTTPEARPLTKCPKRPPDRVWFYQNTIGWHHPVHRWDSEWGKTKVVLPKFTGTPPKFWPLGGVPDRDPTFENGVLIVEGEPCVDAAKAFGINNATTWCGGTNRWDQTDWNPVSGLSVVLWPDRDEAGIKAMHQLAAHLHRLDCSVSIVPHTGDIPESHGTDIADITDPAEAHATLETAVPWEPGPETPELPPDQTPPEQAAAKPITRNPLTVVQPYSERPRRVFAIDGGLLPVSEVTILGATPGTAKSLLSLYIAVAVASGRTIAGISPEASRPRPVWIISAEDDLQTIQERLEAMEVAHNREPGEYLNNITVSNAEDIACRFGDPPTPLLLMQEIQKELTENPARLVILDTLMDLNSMDENSNTEMHMIMDGIRGIARNGECAVMVNHHLRKPAPGEKSNGTSFRGASSIIAKVRQALILEWIELSDGAGWALQLSVEKSNHSSARGAEKRCWRVIGCSLQNQGTAPAIVEHHAQTPEEAIGTEQLQIWRNTVSQNDGQLLQKTRAENEAVKHVARAMGKPVETEILRVLRKQQNMLISEGYITVREAKIKMKNRSVATRNVLFWTEPET